MTGNPMFRFFRVVAFAAFFAVGSLPAQTEFIQSLSEADEAAAQAILEHMSPDGDETEEADAEGVKWLRRAAGQGDAVAQCNLGMLYLDGEGVEQSDAEAVKWFCRAAEQGHTEAQNALGFMYYRGRGTVL